MTALAWLIPAALFLGLLGLAAFLWALRSGQFEDLEGAGWRAIQDSERPDVPVAGEEDGGPDAPPRRD
jgi:cbb3-type cytochrome oxidase maturation protein